MNSRLRKLMGALMMAVIQIPIFGTNPANDRITSFFSVQDMSCHLHACSTMSIMNNPFRYGTYYTDYESGMNYCNARYYSCELMDFVTRDTYDVPNRYAYCMDNPILFIDPTWHKKTLPKVKLDAIEFTCQNISRILTVHKNGTACYISSGTCSPSSKKTGEAIPTHGIAQSFFYQLNRWDTWLSKWGDSEYGEYWSSEKELQASVDLTENVSENSALNLAIKNHPEIKKQISVEFNIVKRYFFEKLSEQTGKEINAWLLMHGMPGLPADEPVATFYRPEPSEIPKAAIHAEFYKPEPSHVPASFYLNRRLGALAPITIAGMAVTAMYFIISNLSNTGT